jgi:hypothetical protein
MSRVDAAGASPLMPGDRRSSSGLLRVPFVRRCALEFDGGHTDTGFIVNINVLGVYIARDVMPDIGETVRCRFRIPETERDMAPWGVVAWTNSRQQHPVHSLPPGFGISFRGLTDEDRRRIETIVDEYLARHPHRRF